MNKTLLAIPLIAGAIAVAGCGSSSDQSSQAADARGDIEKNLKSATTEAGTSVRRADGARALPRTGLRIVNKLDRMIQLRVTGVDNYDWGSSKRPDNRQPQGFQYAFINANDSVLAPHLDVNTNASSAPFNVQFITSSPTAPIAEIRLNAMCIVNYNAVRFFIVGRDDSQCKHSQTQLLDVPQGEYTLRLQKYTCKSRPCPETPGVLTITSTANPRW